MMKLKMAAATAPVQMMAMSAAAAVAPLRVVSSTRTRSSLKAIHDAPAKPVASSATLHTSSAQIRSKAASEAAKLARRDRVVLEHLPLVKAIAVRVHENLPVHVDLDDLVHAGILGLFDAASKFNPEKQVVFSSYAKHRIKGAILDSLRQLDWASRDMRRRHKQVEAATRELAADAAAQSDRTGSGPEAGHGRGTLAHHDARPAQRRSDLGLHARQRKRRSSRSRFPEQARNPSRFHLRARATAQRAGRRHEDAAGALPESGSRCTTPNEMTMKEIGGILGINESRVSQIHKAALEKMQRRSNRTALRPARRSNNAPPYRRLTLLPGQS